jgi:patatin-like phospholipase
MDRPAFELHEVLESEYTSMYGSLDETDNEIIDAGQILNFENAKKRIRDHADGSVRNEAELVATLNAFRLTVDGPDSPRQRIDSARARELTDTRAGVSHATRALLGCWDKYDTAAKCRLNRRVIDEILGDAIRHFHNARYSADQIRDVAGAKLTLRSFMNRDLKDAADVANTLETLRLTIHGAVRPSELLFDSPLLSSGTRSLIEKYDDYSPDDQLRINRRIIDEVFCDTVLSFRDASLQRLYARLHRRAAEGDQEKGRTALCLSGGGIRSATFALGILQGLASIGLLDRIDYLSTVSGGGYIGSWLSSWARRHPRGITGVQDDLASTEFGNAGQRTAPTARAIEPEARPVRHLREYSNYLTPKLGVLSADTWTIASLYLRNLMLNLLLVILPLLAGTLAVPRLFEFVIIHGGWLRHHSLLIPGTDWLLVFTDALLLFGFWYLGETRPVDHGVQSELRILRQFSTDVRFAFLCVVPLTGAALGMAIYWAQAAYHGDLLGSRSAIAAAWIAIGGMLLAPSGAFYWRCSKTSFVQRRTSIATVKSDLVTMWGRFRLEFLGALLGLVTVVVLLWIGVYVIADDPLRALQAVDGQPFRNPLSPSTTPAAELFTCFAVPYVLLAFFVQATIFVGVAGWRNDDYDREWWGRAGAWLLIAAFGFAAISAITIFGPVALFRAPILLGSVGGATGLIAVLVGRSARTPANMKQKQDAGPMAAASGFGLALVVPVFTVISLAFVSLATTWVIQRATGHKNPDAWNFQAQLSSVATARPQQVFVGRVRYSIVEKTEAMPRVSVADLRGFAHLQIVRATSWQELGLLAVILLFGCWFSRYICVNRFSMHALYRNRLVRAYLGASRFGRDPDPFTGFDPYDDFPMWKLRPEMLWGTSIRNLEAFMEELITALERPKLSRFLVESFCNDSRELLYRVVAANRVEGLCRAIATGAEPTGFIIDSGLPANSEAGKLVARYGRKALKAIEKKRSVEGILVAARLDLLDRGDKSAGAAALFQDLNTIIDGNTDLSAYIDSDRSPADTRCLAIRNRRTLDKAYPNFIVAMAPDEREMRKVPVCRVVRDGNGQLETRPPLHIINVALNLVSGDKLAWQQRKAESFTISPLHSGSLNVGYRSTSQYGGIIDGISLGTAVTISGAAASPNMGYHSSPALSFLLTLFNVRLGAWLGNPGPVGQKGDRGKEVYRQANPSTTLSPLIAEALGKTSDDYEWVYLSDGGHFENLGLYEMVLRRCHSIVVSDAGCDPRFSFEDLGNAVRKIRTDLGVPIELKEIFMYPRDDEKLGKYCAYGEIQYSAVDGPDAVPGHLIYIKPGFYRADPMLPKDVFNYGLECREFPHESTGDQWFNETQFESYRALGRHVIDEIRGTYPSGGSGMSKFVMAAKATVVGSTDLATEIRQKLAGWLK